MVPEEYRATIKATPYGQNEPIRAEPAEDYTFDAEDVAHQIREREQHKDALIDSLNVQIRELRKLLWMLYIGEN